MFRVIMFLFFLLASFNTPAQVNPLKLDSLERSMDSVHMRVHHWQDSFIHNEDSLVQARIQTQVKGRDRDQPGTGSRERIGAWIYLPVITGISGMVILLALWGLRKKKQD